MHKHTGAVCLRLLLLSFLLISGCSGLGSAKPEANSAAAQHDTSASESLAEKDKCAPAIEWLQDTSKHNLWKGDRTAILKHFEEQQRVGATAISAVDIAKEEGHEICASFVLTLPDGPKRREVITAHNNFWKTYLGPDASPEDLKEFTAQDQGQKYLFYNFDL